MKNLSDYLKRFTVALSLKTDEVRAVRECVQEMFSVDISKEAITVKEKVIYLSTSPALKTEIFINKKAILNRLHEKGLKFIVDLR